MQLTQLVQVKLLQNYVNASQLGWATRANRSREPSSSMAAAEVLEPVEPCSGAFLATEWLRGLCVCVCCVLRCVCVCPLVVFVNAYWDWILTSCERHDVCRIAFEPDEPIESFIVPDHGNESIL